MKRKTACILITVFSLFVVSLWGGYLFVKSREHTASAPQNTLVQNFDGIMDLCLYQGYYGTGADFYHAVFLFDRDSGLYTEAQGFPKDNIQLVPDKQCIDSGYRLGPAEHCVDRYQYIDGELTHVAALSLYDFWEDDARGVDVRDERLINGEWQIYREETILLDEDDSAEAYDEAYGQLQYLYIDDGYWDL